jgi:hypothetical protein
VRDGILPLVSYAFVTSGALLFSEEAAWLRARASTREDLPGAAWLAECVDPGTVLRRSGDHVVVSWVYEGDISASEWEPTSIAISALTLEALRGSVLCAFCLDGWNTKIHTTKHEADALSGLRGRSYLDAEAELRAENLRLGVLRPDERVDRALLRGEALWEDLLREMSAIDLRACMSALMARRAAGDAFFAKLGASAFDDLYVRVGDRIVVLCDRGSALPDFTLRGLDVLARVSPAADAARQMVSFVVFADPLVAARATELAVTCDRHVVVEECARWFKLAPGSGQERDVCRVRLAKLLAHLPPTREVRAVAKSARRYRVSSPAYAELLGEILARKEAPSGSS